ncbi:PLD nuclease N-terminal domain-containing protein [Amycolatopsis sp. FDAARGOS 1241]|uniref:PLD nuclease N-terminal domain-containing protein n=1 Tax=Amycolatopsis sp. FDAARGOS 1241 TaxID=2778070 RepID=UPI001EF20D12|nr:PLD nuclease N-terminal domain-containing protein [Amycolatopsis sp. FDAARGOS 1241]
MIQIALTATAWWDLAHRRADQVRGPKTVWAVIIVVNFAGPLAYFRWGRLRSGCQGPVERGPSAPE